MMFEKQYHAAGQALLDVDDETHKLCAPYIDTLPVKALGLISKVGDQPELRTISGALIVVGTLAGKDRLVKAGARMMIAHEAATAAKDLVKTEIDRKRPRSADERTQKEPKKGTHTAKEMTSFPSGHSAGAIAAARAFSREFPEYGPVAVGAAAFIALLQILRSAHYPTDVVAGLALGLAAEALVDRAWDVAGMDERSSD
jgi:membrane-associated phospholipid phosphatase